MSERDEITDQVRKEVNASLDAAERTLALIGEQNADLDFGVRKVGETEREVCIALNIVLETLGRIRARPLDSAGLDEAIRTAFGEIVARDLPICAPSVTHSRFIGPDDEDPGPFPGT